MTSFHNAILELKRNYQQADKRSFFYSYFFKATPDTLSTKLNKYNDRRPSGQETIDVVAAVLRHSGDQPCLNTFKQSIQQTLENISSPPTDVQQIVGAWIILAQRKMFDFDKQSTLGAMQIFNRLHQSKLFNSHNLHAVAKLESYANVDADCHFNPIIHLIQQLEQLPKTTLLTQAVFNQLLADNTTRCVNIMVKGNNHPLPQVQIPDRPDSTLEVFVLPPAVVVSTVLGRV